MGEYRRRIQERLFCTTSQNKKSNLCMFQTLNVKIFPCANTESGILNVIDFAIINLALQKPHDYKTYVAALFCLSSGNKL